jgi:hypothetical protein
VACVMAVGTEGTGPWRVPFSNPVSLLSVYIIVWCASRELVSSLACRGLLQYPLYPRPHEPLPSTANPHSSHPRHAPPRGGIIRSSLSDPSTPLRDPPRQYHLRAPAATPPPSSAVPRPRRPSTRASRTTPPLVFSMHRHQRADTARRPTPRAARPIKSCCLREMSADLFRHSLWSELSRSWGTLLLSDFRSLLGYQAFSQKLSAGALLRGCLGCGKKMTGRAERLKLVPLPGQ